MADNFFTRLFGGGSNSTEGMTDKSEARSSGIVSELNNRIVEHKHIEEKVHHSIVPNFSMIPLPGGEYNTISALTSALIEGSKTKESLAKKLEPIRDYDYIEALLRDLSTDVLTRSYDPSQSEFFTFSTSNEDYLELNEKVNADLSNLKLYDMLYEIIEDYLFYGQYILKMDYVAEELDDCLDQNSTLPAYSKGKMVKIYDQNERMLRDPANYLVFSLFTSHKKIKVKSQSGSFYSLKLPKGIIPESIISKINNLKLLEALQPLVELQAIDEKMYFHVRFPPGKDATEAYRECRDYEKLLKSMLTMDEAKSVDEIVDRVSRIKVIPLFGNQEEMRAQQVNKINRIDLNQIRDLRDSISNALKINIDGQNATNPEYYKLIKRIRNLIRISVQEFLVGFIRQKYSITIDPEDFEVILPEVQGAEDLDTIEFINMHQSTYRDILSLIERTDETIQRVAESPFIDKEQLIDSYSDKIMKLTGTRMFKNYETLMKDLEKSKDTDDKDLEETLDKDNE